jgi:cbb3-type cytochrome oxidase subunit 3
MMDWIPVVFVTFKVLVLGTGMFFAIKWHYDQGKKREMATRAVLAMAGKVAAAFSLLLLCVVFFAFFLGKKMGLDLTLP